MPYVLRKTDGKGAAVYVAPPGSLKSYVTLTNAHRYLTQEAAEADACGNETSIKVRV